MDPLSQGALGAIVPQSVVDRGRMGAVVTLGALSGMAPDLDILIQSATDPLLFLEFHRQFTHALVFIPFGALICAAVLYPLFRRVFDFRTAYLVCFLGYATHGLLDACTSYGTQLFWPFTNHRVSWNTVSIIDPLFTFPMVAAIGVAIWRGRRAIAIGGFVWALAYMAVGALQNARVEAHADVLASARGHDPQRITAKPGFGNLLVWKLIYEDNGMFHVDAIRAGLAITHCGGASVARLGRLARLDDMSQQARDIERFRWFSDDYIAVDPGSPDDRPYVIDVRYSVVPDRIDALWGVVVDRAAPIDSHVDFVPQRRGSADQIAAYQRILSGDACG